MKNKNLLLVILVMFFLKYSNGQSIDSIRVNKNRVVLVSSSLGLYFGASFYYVQNSWWSDISNDFRFDPGNDLVYALNVDKAAHFFGGLYASDLFSSSYRWAGLSNKKSLWYGAFFGSGIQLAIEMKDAYAPYWGFSMWDFGTGSVGSFWPVFQEYILLLRLLILSFHILNVQTFIGNWKQKGEEHQVNFHGMMIIQTKLTG